MSADFPRAWELVAETRLAEHHPKCSYRVTERALLCDCDVLMTHPEVTDTVMHTAGGKVGATRG